MLERAMTVQCLKENLRRMDYENGIKNKLLTHPCLRLLMKTGLRSMHNIYNETEKSLAKLSMAKLIEMSEIIRRNLDDHQDKNVVDEGVCVSMHQLKLLAYEHPVIYRNLNLPGRLALCIETEAIAFSYETLIKLGNFAKECNDAKSA